MDITESNLQQLAAYLQKTLSLDPIERRGAEKFLESIENNQNYSILLLNLVDKADLPIHMRVSGSIIFKNYIKRNWPIQDDGSDRVHEKDRFIIKQGIVGVMLKAPEQIQKQLSDAISCIGREDFPDKWPSLMDEMIGKFETGDIHVINGVLHTAHSIFKRYRHEFQSNKLWTEIKFVLDKFAMPFTQLTNKMMELAQLHANSPDNLRIIYSSIILICKIFYSLNFQDLPEFFEDNMQTWMNHFHILLNADCKLLETDDKDEPGVMEQVKTQVCDNLTMYAQKYDEEFCTHLPSFVTDVWHLLINTGVSVKYDLLVSNAIQFLASVADRPGYKKLFEDPGTLSSICEKIIVPNMEFRDADEEAFEDNAEEYIRRDIEGSDVDTRRRAACDLVRALSKSFEETVIKNFSIYIQNMLQAYQANPQKNWKSKDAAIFLVTSLAAKAQTQKHGITQTSQLVNVTEFFTNHIAPDLNHPNVNENPVIKADTIKYVMVFRNQLSREILVSCLAPLLNHLLSTSHVVHSYSACCLDKILSMKPPVVTKAELTPCCSLLLQNLFTAMNVVGSQENEYIMRGIMKSLHVLQDSFIPHVQIIMSQLLDKLNAVSKNPSKPHFNHSLFESLCIVISVTCKFNPGSQVVQGFEEPLFPIFQNILQQDVQEFVPYIFQVLSLMLEMHTTTIPDPYMSLFPILLQPLLWERSGNVPALVRLLQAYIAIGFRSNQIPADKLPGLLGVFQKLLASRSNDHFGMQLLNSLFVHVPQNHLDRYVQQVFMLLFQKLTTSKTTKYVKCVLVLFSLFIVKYSASTFIELIDKIQARMFKMVLEKLYIPELPKITNSSDRKLCAVAVTKILCEPVLLKDDSYAWLPLLQALMETLESPIHSSGTGEEVSTIVETAEHEGFQAAYSQLLYSGKQEVDYCADVPDAKVHLAKAVHLLCNTSPKVKAILSGLPPDAQKCLSLYFNAAGVSIA